MNDFTPEQQAELDRKWAELEKLFAEAKWHPVCPKVMLLLVADDGVTWRKEWNRDMADKWWKLVEPYAAEKTHRKALEDLIKVAAFVHHEYDRAELATGLIVLVSNAVAKWKLVDFDVDAKFDVASEDVEAKQVTGAAARPIPAKVGEKPPEGALRPDQLGKGPRRI